MFGETLRMRLTGLGVLFALGLPLYSGTVTTTSQTTLLTLIAPTGDLTRPFYEIDTKGNNEIQWEGWGFGHVPPTGSGSVLLPNPYALSQPGVSITLVNPLGGGGGTVYGATLTLAIDLALAPGTTMRLGQEGTQLWDECRFAGGGGPCSSLDSWAPSLSSSTMSLTIISMSAGGTTVPVGLTYTTDQVALDLPVDSSLLSALAAGSDLTLLVAQSAAVVGDSTGFPLDCKNCYVGWFLSYIREDEFTATLTIDGVPPSEIPEPSTYALMAAGLGALVYAYRRRRS